MRGKKLRWQLPFLAVLIIGSFLIVRKQYTMPYITNTGLIFGTVYKITYQYPDNLQSEIEAQLAKVNQSLSPFNPNSIITQINENDSLARPDSMFLRVFHLADSISQTTNGAFDITVAPLVNAWGFGFKQNQVIDSATIDSLKSLIGMRKVVFDGEKIIKSDSRIMLDCSAIAKGYG